MGSTPAPPAHDNHVVEILNNSHEAAHEHRQFQRPRRSETGLQRGFQGQNKSAIIADLMLEAVERARGKQRSIEAYRSIQERRKHAPVFTKEEFRAARDADRPRSPLSTLD